MVVKGAIQFIRGVFDKGLFSIGQVPLITDCDTLHTRCRTSRGPAKPAAGSVQLGGDIPVIGPPHQTDRQTPRELSRVAPPPPFFFF